MNATIGDDFPDGKEFLGWLRLGRTGDPLEGEVSISALFEAHYGNCLSHTRSHHYPGFPSKLPESAMELLWRMYDSPFYGILRIWM